MKKLVLVMAVVAFGFTASAQDGFRAGFNAGFVTGDMSDFSSFAYGLDLDYDFNVSNGVNVGIATGFAGYSGKDGYESHNYIPAAGSVDFDLSDDFSAGADLGMAIWTGDSGGSDFMYNFQVRYQTSEKMDVTARYNNISGDGFTSSNFSVGIGFRF